MKNSYVFFLFAMFVVAFTAVAQEVPAAGIEEMSKGQMWDYVIALVAPVVVAGVKWLVPKVPKVALPMITPFVGIGLGFALNAVADANLDAITMAKAGAMAVFVRETVNQTLKATGISKDEKEVPTSISKQN
jgi:hypothetical protein